MDISQKIRVLRKRKGLKQEELAEIVGVTQATVSRWELGQQFPEYPHLIALSRWAEEDFVEFSFGEEHQFKNYNTNVPVIGAVQAGHWVESIEWAPSDRFDLSIPDDPRYPELRRTGFVVRGASMNKVFAPGSIVICVNLIQIDRNPVSGEYVLVRRRDPNGLYEATIKEYEVDAANVPSLWPRSTDPEFSSALRITPPAEADENDDIQVTGVVVSSVRLEGPLVPPPALNPR